MYFCVPKCRLPWHKVKPIKAKKDVKEFYAQKHKWRRGKEEEIKLKNKHSMTIKSRIRLLSLHSIQRTRLLAALDSYRSKAYAKLGWGQREQTPLATGFGVWSPWDQLKLGFLRLTEVAGEGGPDLVPQKFFIGHIMGCKRYVNKICLPCLVHLETKI